MVNEKLICIHFVNVLVINKVIWKDGGTCEVNELICSVILLVYRMGKGSGNV